MRKQAKEQLIHIINTLPEVHGQLLELVGEEENAQAQRLLEGLAGIGDNIKQQLGVEQEIESISEKLEEYLSWVDVVYAKLSLPGEELPEELREVDAFTLTLQLDPIAAELAKTVEEELPVQFEIAFFPYKVSMWDAMESVYLAAKADPACIPYVVPVPYYDKDSEDRLGQMHYEGDLFPKEIPVYPYYRYDLKEHHPDIIVIHNLYDDTNFVTCIKEEYHSKNLKKYTDLLVFIPYFTTNGGLAEVYRDLPGYYNVDYVISQSEGQTRFYNGYHWDKLIPLGSPKFDRVLNTKVDRDSLPEDWKSALRERVVFLNLSITGLLTHNEVMIRRLRGVLRDIRKREQEVTLLYRPHPLIETTLEAMRPELYEDYRRLLEEFAAAPNVIIDRTPIPETAIALSEAYIGEVTSSIVALFAAAGKPVYLVEQEDFDLDKATNCVERPDASNLDGTAGEKIYSFLKERLEVREKLRKEIHLLRGVDVGEYEKYRKIPPLPSEWEAKIRREDGSSRKVIVYDTSLGAVSCGDREYLDKIRDVLRIFSEHREEICLLWRPHPSAAEVPMGQRPEYWNEYLSLVDGFRKEDWGILDESADEDRAFFYADAYYGDMDALAEVFRKEHKPVMLQNVSVRG